MCARYTLYHPVGMLAAHFSALSDGLTDPMEELSSAADTLDASYNIAPTYGVVVVMEDGARRLQMMRWGLIPGWAGAQQKPLVNARAETLLEKPSFREAVRKRRCIVPASGFYEWKKAGKERLPYHISRCDGQPMAFAGLWEPGLNGAPPTCTIVTVTSNSVIAPLHDRMPAILDESGQRKWLDVAGVGSAEAASLLRPAPDDWIQMHPVSPRVNRLGVNDSDCIVPAEHAPAAERTLFDL